MSKILKRGAVRLFCILCVIGALLGVFLLPSVLASAFHVESDVGQAFLAVIALAVAVFLLFGRGTR